jgi:NADH dehydrogenase
MTRWLSPPAPATPILGMTNGSRSRRGSKRWRTPPRCGDVSWSPLSAPSARTIRSAGTIAELAQDTLAPDFRNIDTHRARVVLIEAGPRVLAGFADELSAYAQASLESIGVEVVLGKAVTECSADGVVYGGERLQAKTLIWAAGVRASPAAEWLGAAADRAGRLQVEPDLTVAGHPDIFAIGDTVLIAGPDGRPVPGIAPAAKQQGRHVAETIKARLGGGTSAPFRYRHAGSLAQIGKRKAVIDFGRIKLRGALAWWIWGIAHIYFLIGLRNRLSVAISWLWIHARDQRAARLITQGSSKVAGAIPTTDPAYKISKPD